MSHVVSSSLRNSASSSNAFESWTSTDNSASIPTATVATQPSKTHSPTWISHSQKWPTQAKAPSKHIQQHNGSTQLIIPLKEMALEAANNGRPPLGTHSDKTEINWAWELTRASVLCFRLPLSFAAQMS